MLNLALKLCKKSDHRQHHHGCIVTRGGAVVAMGYNRGETHAEVAALKKMWPSERKGTKLWSIRFLKSGRFGMAKPCKNCMKFIIESGVKVLYYTDETGSIIRVKL